ncbi:hypothetical protein CP533_4854 [Ophiocordyceps camponoti-saundersi (nom. inval.)]|nr:hypothetical protein CP533_4854 [Ophiocordyceps camponoti-saundersi (nom. inval.)]
MEFVEDESERRGKRRRVEGLDSPLAGRSYEDAEVMPSSSEGWHENHHGSTQQQPTFLAAPRFITSTETSDGSSQAPRRRPRGNNNFLPGGLAATLQEALSEARGRAEAEKEDDDDDVVRVEEVWSSSRIMQLVGGRRRRDELSLTVHQRDTFTKWELPLGTNLIVVVSFGLFVPPRILRSTKYGGVNVHPSFLPDLRGPAPIHHAILRGDDHIGITLQTLDEERFDHGTILAQTRPPGLPVASGATLQEVTAMAATAGAEMLVQSLVRDHLHVPPHRHAGWKEASISSASSSASSSPPPLKTAPKVSKADAQINWEEWRGGNWQEEVSRRIRVFAAVWTRVLDPVSEESRRVFVRDAHLVLGEVLDLPTGNRGTICFVREGEDAVFRRWETDVVLDLEGGACALRVELGMWVRVQMVKVEGKNWVEATVALRPFSSLRR